MSTVKPTEDFIRSLETDVVDVNSLPEGYCFVPQPKGIIHYNLWGNGSIKVMFVHGLLRPGCFWGQEDKYQICVFDNRGTGKSSTNPLGWWTSRDMARDAVCLLDYLHWNKVHIIGISMGGMICQELSKLIPYRMCSLSLLATYPNFVAVPTSDLSTQIVLGLHSFLRSANLKAKLTPLFIAPKHWTKEEKSLLQPLFKKLEESIPFPTYSSVISHLITVMSHNFSSQDMDSVRQTGLPIISVHGSQDAAIDCANSDVITKGLKCKQFIIQNQGHGLELTATKELYDIITKHWEQGEKEWSSRKFIPSVIDEDKKEKKCCHSLGCFNYIYLQVLKGLIFGLIAYIFMMPVSNIKMIVAFALFYGLSAVICCAYNNFIN